MSLNTRIAAPFGRFEGEVLPEWIDYNGHLNLAYYVVLFDQATDLLFDELDLGLDYRRNTGKGTFVAETHTLYENELLVGARVRVATQILGSDEQRLLPVAPLVGLEPGLVGSDDGGKLGKAFRGVVRQGFVNRGRTHLALDLEQIEPAQRRAGFERLRGRAGEQHGGAEMLVGALQAGGEVHIVADHRVFEPAPRAERAGQHLAGGDADADLDCVLSGLPPPLVEAVELDDHLGGDGERVVGIRRIAERGADHRHDRVADVFVEHAAVREHHLDHAGEIIVEHGHRVLRAHRLGDRRKPPDIREQHGGDVGMALQEVFAAGDQPIDDLFRDIARHGVAHPLLAGDVFEYQHIADRL